MRKRVTTKRDGFLFVPKPVNIEEVRQRLLKVRPFDPQKRVAKKKYTYPVQKKWIVAIGSVAPGTHPLDKAVLPIIASSTEQFKSLNRMLNYCSDKLKETKTHFTRTELEIRLRALIKGKLIPDFRYGSKGTQEKVKVVERNFSALSKNPFFKEWRLFGNNGLVEKYRENTGNAVAQKQIEDLMLAANPKKTAEQIRTMLRR